VTVKPVAAPDSGFRSTPISPVSVATKRQASRSSPLVRAPARFVCLCATHGHFCLKIPTSDGLIAATRTGAYARCARCPPSKRAGGVGEAANRWPREDGEDGRSDVLSRDQLANKNARGENDNAQFRLRDKKPATKIVAILEDHWWLEKVQSESAVVVNWSFPARGLAHRFRHWRLTKATR
jgi:hypothetical protein